VAMSFIVLDVEIVFLYPFATVFRELGGFGLGLMAVFVAALLIPFGYLLSVGALSWGPRQVADTMRELTPVLRSRIAIFDPSKREPEAAEGEAA
ncbi:MAG TPA: NADH-quinone oxidoreductase subunit A, partial [Acidimicrobiia bacterium]